MHTQMYKARISLEMGQAVSWKKFHWKLMKKSIFLRCQKEESKEQKKTAKNFGK